MVANSMREMALAQPSICQQIEGTTQAAITIGDGKGCREREAVPRAHHELIKGESPIQAVHVSVLLRREG